MILQEAILHIPLSQYAFANSEMNLTIRIRGELYQLQSDWMLKRMTEEFQHFVLSVSYI